MKKQLLVLVVLVTLLGGLLVGCNSGFVPNKVEKQEKVPTEISGSGSSSISSQTDQRGYLFKAFGSKLNIAVNISKKKLAKGLRLGLRLEVRLRTYQTVRSLRILSEVDCCFLQY